MRRHLQIAIAASALVVLAHAASAQRKSPLEGQPAIRHRLDLRSGRVELTPFFGFTVLQHFNNSVMGGGKLHYHINDWLGLGGFFGGGIFLDTGVKSEIVQTLSPCNVASTMRDPNRCDATNAMNHMLWAAGGELDVTPISGKLSFFGKGFFHYDLYLDVGASFVQLESGLSQTNSAPTNCAVGMSGGNTKPGCNVGMRIGGNAAVGMHLFLNDFMAVSLEYRALIIRDNQSGMDVNGDKLINDADLAFSPHSLISLGLAFYLPATADVSR